MRDEEGWRDDDEGLTLMISLNMENIKNESSVTLAVCITSLRLPLLQYFHTLFNCGPSITRPRNRLRLSLST